MESAVYSLFANIGPSPGYWSGEEQQRLRGDTIMTRTYAGPGNPSTDETKNPPSEN